FGCADSRQASEYALLTWQRRARNRRAVSFDTEMEGLIPILGQRMAVAHTLPRWGQSGVVVAVDATTLVVQVDRLLQWDAVTPPYVMMFRDEYSGASGLVECTRGPTDAYAILASDPWAGTSGDWRVQPEAQESTHFAFGNGTQVVKDFILSQL